MILEEIALDMAGVARKASSLILQRQEKWAFRRMLDDFGG